MKNLFIQILTISVLILHIKTLPCPKKCVCSMPKHYATCSHLSALPDFPSYVETLNLKENTFTNVTKHFFQKLEKLKLKSLNLITNQIRFLDQEAFSNLTSLEHLKISNECELELQSIKNALNGLQSTKFTNLMLEKNGWTSISDEVFSSGSLQQLTYLSLSKNKLTNFSFGTIKHLRNLRHLDLTGNEMSSCYFIDPVPLRRLDIGENYIGLLEVPSFCYNRTEKSSNLPYLVVLNLNGNLISELLPSFFYCLPSLQNLRLDSNILKELRNDTFNVLPKLKKLRIQSNTDLKYINSYAFRSLSLVELFLNLNNFMFKKPERFDAVNIFREIPRLRYLDLTNNHLPTDDKMLQQMFCPLHNLKSLVLQRTFLNFLPKDVFPCMISLQILSLQGNGIGSWKKDTFANMTKLISLNLNGNNIHLMNKSSIPENVLSRLGSLDLSNNPFTCTCDLLWFRNWLKVTNVTMKNFPYKYKCRYPEIMKKKLIVHYNPTEESCTPWNPLFTLAAVTSSFGFVVLLVIFIVYKCHPNIRNYFYHFRLFRLKKQGYLRLENSEDFEYHAYVLYCDSDSEWVHNVFLGHFEKEGLKLCIRSRDFDVGANITDNVDRYLKKCWKVIIIMSNDFAKCEWCQWEVEFVQDRRRRQGKDAFLLIMLQTITSDHMTTPIKTLLKTTPYLICKKSVGGKLFWKSATESLRRPLGIPPMAV